MTARKKDLMWTDVALEHIKAAIDIIDGDGHTIFKPEAFIEAGVPQEIVDRCTDVHESDLSSHKATIFVDGKPTNAVKGVYGLAMLSTMIRDLGLTAPDYLGRGFQARAWTEAINAYIERKKETSTV